MDRSSPQSLGAQLCAALREMILGGGLAAGERLAATRTLARELSVSRTTVVEAFERLTAEGLLVSRTGAGTFVSSALRGTRPMPPKGGGRATERTMPRMSKTMTQAIERFGERPTHPPRAFEPTLPCFEMFPVTQWARLSAKYLRASRDLVMGHPDPCGLPQLRSAVASHLRVNRGVACDPEQIVIVGGAQQAFHLIASVLLNPGERVWFENPGAIGVRNSFIACGAKLVPVPVDAEGLCVEEGLKLSPQFRLAFVTPSHQQPTSSVMSLERRFSLLHAAERAKAWVIEDDYDGEFFFDSLPQPTLKSIDTTGLVIYVGTFSKSLFPALRLGYFVAPPSLVDVFHAVASRFFQGPPSYTQAVVAEFIGEGYFAAHLRRMRQVYQERHQALLLACRQRLAGLLDVVPAHGGLHTVGHLNASLPEALISADADARQITAFAIGRFSLAPIAQNGLVLGFGGVAPMEIAQAVNILGEILERRHRDAPPVGSEQRRW